MMKLKTILITLVLAALISISVAGSTQDIPRIQTPDAIAPIIQVTRAETSVESVVVKQK